MGNIYYRACPIYTRIELGHICACENRFYIIEINGKKLHNCLPLTSACPTGNNFYNFWSKKCYSGPDCDVANYTKKYETNENARWASSCMGEEFYKKLSDEGPEICIDSCDRHTSIENSKKYCRDDCPENYKNKNCIYKEEWDFYVESVENLDYCLNSCEESGGKLKHNFGTRNS